MHEISFSIFPNQSFVDLGLYQYGREMCEPGHSFGPARRNHYLFHYVLSGRGTLWSDNGRGKTVTHSIHGGQGFLIVPEQTNTYVADLKDPWEYTWLEFDGLRVKQALDMAGLTEDQPIYRTKSSELSARMQEEMLYLVGHSEESVLHLIGHLYLFLDYLTRSALGGSEPGGGKLRDFYIREAIACIENHYQEDISVEDIADTVGLNRSYFGKIFRMATGKAPQQFLMNYRMIKAADLLTLSQMPVREIGAAVGYPNQMHFSRAFKTVYGVSPREWRNRHRTDPGQKHP